MVVNQDHYINEVFHDAGRPRPDGRPSSTRRRFSSPRGSWSIPPIPTTSRPSTAIQDQLATRRRLGEAVRDARLRHGELRRDPGGAARARRSTSADFDHAFGTRDEVDPVRHLLATAAGWGGLPDQRGVLHRRRPGLPVGRVQAHRRRRARRRVLVDLGLQRRRLLRAQRSQTPTASTTSPRHPNDDGSITVHFGGCGDGRPNCLPIIDGWNYLVRLYRPRPEILDGSWTFPSVEPA